MVPPRLARRARRTTGRGGGRGPTPPRRGASVSIIRRGASFSPYLGRRALLHAGRLSSRWPKPGRRARSPIACIPTPQAARGQQLYQSAVRDLSRRRARGRRSVRRLPATVFSRSGAREPLADLVNKIEQTMPPQQPGSLSRAQAIDLASFMLRAGKFAAGPSDLGPADAGTDRVSPRARLRQSPSTGASSFAVAGNLAQLMRGVTFPNANILFNVQAKDPAKDKPAMPIPFDYFLWGSTGALRMAGGRSGRADARRNHAALPAPRTAL